MRRPYMTHRAVNERTIWERECFHRRTGAAGEFYQGTSFVRRLQGLKGGAALAFANRVTPFFWADAPRVQVWLCGACAGELKLDSSTE